MTQKRLVIEVRPDGTVHAETVGMHGDECLDYITVLEDLLDAETTSSSFTEDYTRSALQQELRQDEHDRGTA